jgi:DNA-binding GntR family transcriptional regulator
VDRLASTSILVYEKAATNFAVADLRRANLRNSSWVRGAIEEALIHYCALVDEKLVDGIVQEIFAVDATEDHGPGFVPVTGAAALRDHFHALLSPVAKSVHNVSNLRTVASDDTATSVSNLTAYVWLEDREQSPNRPPDLVVLASYHDEWRRSGDDWKICRRRLEPVATYRPNRS